MKPDSSFYQSLGSMHRAGVGWPEAFRSVGATSKTCMGIAARLEAGDSLSDSLGPFVDPVDHALVRAGEASGSLEQTMDRLAAWHDEEERDRGERRTALAYPVFVALIGSVLMAVPDLMRGNVVGALGWSLLILAPTGLFVWIATRRRSLEAKQRSLPRWGPWRNRVDETDARALAVLAACEEAGVPMDEAVRLAARAGPGGRVAEDLTQRAIPRIAEGQDLAGAWHAVGENGARLAAAEHAGALGKTAREIADRLRFDVRNRRKRSLARLPAYLTLIVGAVVLIRLISFYGGYYADLGRIN